MAELLSSANLRSDLCKERMQTENMMKKGLAVVLGVFMVFSMAACGDKDKKETTGTTAAVETVGTETTAAETVPGETDAGTAASGPEMPEYVSAFDLGDISEYVELGEYKGIQVKAQDLEVTDEEIEAEIKAQVESAVPSYEQVTEGTVAKGDVTNIDFVGRMDGEVFSGGSGEGFDLTIGSGQFIPGFEDGLIGKNIGDTVVLDLNFPEDYKPNPDFNGKAVEFTVTINYVQGKEIPNELNDEFVSKVTNGECKTVDEYREYMRKERENGKAADAKSNKVNEALEKIEADATFKKEAKELIQYYYDSQAYQVESMIAMYGIDMDSYLSTMGMTEEQYQEELQKYAEQNTRWQLLTRAIVEAENLDFSEEEFESKLEQLASDTGMTVDSLKSAYGEAMLRDILRQQEVQDFVLETVVEAPAE